MKLKWQFACMQAGIVTILKGKDTCTEFLSLG